MPTDPTPEALERAREVLCDGLHDTDCPCRNDVLARRVALAIDEWGRREREAAVWLLIRIAWDDPSLAGDALRLAAAAIKQGKHQPSGALLSRGDT